MSTAALTWRQFRFERKLFWRNPSAAFFNFTLPFLFLIMIASVFGADRKELNILIPGIAGMSVLGTTFTALTYTFVFNREQGILKRIRGTPMPPLAFFGGVIASAVANAIVQVGLIIVIGHVFYDVSWPQSYLELIVFVALGVVAFGSLGIAFAAVIPNFDSAAAYVNAVFLPVIFISGVFYSTKHLPALFKGIAEALPLKHVIDGLSGAIVTGHGLSDNLTALAVVAGWAALGLFLTVRYFRWD
ncbi:MAG TPA: ABC transporter permease [Thermoleophilaceae bacterium]